MRAITPLILLSFIVALPACQKVGTGSDETPRNEPEQRPQPPDGPPYPKAVVDKIVHEFGVMLPHTTGEHDFKITNTGDFPLEIRKGRSSCTCTVSGLSNHKLKKGETATVTLKWEPKQPEGRFDQSVEIYTNDPDNLTIRLQISGMIRKLLSVAPQGRWTVGTVVGDKPAKVEGLVYSAIREEFKITSLTYNAQQMNVTSAPASKSELAVFKAKSGYRITVTIKADQGIGSFSEDLKIKTDLDGGMDVPPIKVVGSRSGPILIRRGTGGLWRSDAMRLTLGRFPAAKGKSASLMLYVGGLGDEELKIEKLKSDPEFLDVTLKPAKQRKVTGTRIPAKSRRRVYELFVRVPPNIAPTTRIDEDHGIVTLWLNHKQIRTFRFAVQFDAY
ncbi:MAG: DUF1573 domain-containing protein [Planctomycetaceae bacterium]